jgi:hypothetical protein
MAGLLIVPGAWPVQDVNGDPVSGATISFFQPGTTTPKTIYSDDTLATVLGTTLTTNAGGEPITLAAVIAREWWAADEEAFDIRIEATGLDRSWNGIPALTPNSGGGGIITNTGIHVSTYGASPNATGIVNRNAIQEAIDYAASLGGAIVDIDVPGYYAIAKRTSAPTDKALIIKKGVTLRGLGTGAPSDATVRQVTLEPSEAMPIFIGDENTIARTCTVTATTPGVFTLTGHGFAAGQPVYFSSDGTSPGGLTRLVPYYVIATGLTTDNFQVSTLPSGTGIAISSVGTGNNYCLSASTLTHSASLKDINIWGGAADPVVMAMVAMSTVGSEFENVLVNPKTAANQRSGWVHLENPIAAWLNNFSKLEIGGFTSGIGFAFFGSDSNITDCILSGCGTNFRLNQGAVTITGGQCENANNGGGIGTGRGLDYWASSTGRNVAFNLSGMKFISNLNDVWLRTSTVQNNSRVNMIVDSHDCRGDSVTIGAFIGNVMVGGTFNEPNPSTSYAIKFENSATATGCTITPSTFSQSANYRILNLPADCENFSGYALSASGATPRRITSKLKDRLDLRDFDSTAGSSTNTSDLTATIQYAINYAQGNKEKLWLPQGILRVSAPLLVTADGFHVEGQGGGGRDDDYDGNTVLTAITGHTGAMLLWGNQAEHVVTGSVSRLTLNAAGLATKGLDFVDAQYINGDDVQILNPTSKGVHFRNNFETANPCGWGTWNALKVFCRSAASVNADGIHLDGTGSAGVSMLTFIQPQVQHRNGHGYRHTGGDGWLFLKPFAFTDGTGDNYRHETTAVYPIGAGTYVHPIGGGPFRIVNNLTAAGTTIRIVDLPTGDGQPLLVGAGRHGVVYDTGDGRKYGRQRLDTALVQFDDDMAFVNYTSPVLRTRSGNFGVTQTGTATVTNLGLIGSAINLGTSTTSGDQSYIADSDVIGSGGFSTASNPQAMWLLGPSDTTSQVVRLGFLNATAGNPNGIYFEHDTAVSGNWFCVTRAAGTSTRTDTGIAVAAVKRQFMIQGGDVDGFFFLTRVDATTGWTQVGNHTTNIPANTVQLNVVTGIRTLTGSARNLYVYHIKHARDME